MGLVSLAAEHITRLVNSVENVTLSCIELHAGQIRDMLSVTPAEPIVAHAGDSALPSSISALPLNAISSMVRLLRLVCDVFCLVVFCVFVEFSYLFV